MEILYPRNIMLRSWSLTDGCDGSTLIDSEERRWLESTANVRVIWS